MTSARSLSTIQRIRSTSTQAKESQSTSISTSYLLNSFDAFKQSALSLIQAYRIVRTAAEETVQDEHISCHSLRKTFGYHAWKNGTPPALLMDVYNHSSYKVTQHYLGIEQDERDEIYLNLEL